MPEVPAGWYADPEGSGQLRWWTGTSWSSTFVPVAPPALAPAPTPAPARPGKPARIAIGSTAGMLGLIGLASSGLGGMLIMVGLVGMGVGLTAMLKGTVKSLGIRSRPLAMGALAASFAVVIAGGVIAPHRDVPTVDAAQVDSPLALESTAAASPTPSAQPIITTREETTTSSVPYLETTVDDPTLAAGTTAITITGVVGVRTTVWRITFSDGDEEKRVKVSDEVTTPPVDQVTAIGSYVPPPPPAPVAPSCDPNYAGQCVPIASDVDCAGGSGNGPAYTYGPVSVVGSDIYQLDRDGDGIACD